MLRFLDLFRSNQLKICSSLMLVAILLSTGCGSAKETLVKSIKVIQGDNQCAAPEAELKKELIIELLGPKHPGLFGGKGESAPVSGIKVRFESVKGSDLLISCENNISNQGGGHNG